MLVLKFFHYRLRFDCKKCMFSNLILLKLVHTCVAFAFNVDYDQTKQSVLSDRECTVFIVIPFKRYPNDKF